MATIYPNLKHGTSFPQPRLLDALKFLTNEGNPRDHRLYFDKIKIDHWESFKNPFNGMKKQIYTKREAIRLAYIDAAN